MTASGDRLIAEALAKSGVIWLTSPTGSGPVWYATLHDVAYVVTGPGEQRSPVHHGPTQVITRSKETRARLLSYEADAETLHPEDDDWDAAVAALIAGRLNAPAGDTEARWREHNTILRLQPDTSSVVVRGEHVTAHECQVEPNASEEPTITSESDTSDVTPATSPSPAAPSVAQPVAPPKNTPESHASETSALEQSAPSPRVAETQPIPLRPRKQAPTTRPSAASSRDDSPKQVDSPAETDIKAPASKPASETTQPIPVRTRHRNTEQTQPIPMQAPSAHRHSPPPREITEPIPVRSRNRDSAAAVPPQTDDVETSTNATKVDQ